MEKVQAEKKSAVELQQRKHQDWTDNYELYRNKVKTNRLTQRQAVNIPLMKETIKTLLSRVDDPPTVNWKELGGDQMKELIFQEVWEDFVKKNKLEVVDILDKKNVLLYGLSVKKLNIGENGIEVSVLDIYDTLLDPLMNTWDLESARFIVVQNIFRTVREILADERYLKSGKDDLKIWADAPAGITHGVKNREEWEKKMERLRSMGVTHKDFPYFAGGDRIVSLTEHYTKEWNAKTKKFEKRVVVYADDSIELMNEKLEDLIGVDFWPFVVWSEDPEVIDVYPDSVADLVRTPNKILNVWFSQLIENRTLKNFQMHWFLPGQNYTPQTYTPGPGVMLPAPPGEDINKVIKPVEVSGLDDTLTAINSVITIVERGTGATAIQKGQAEQGAQTLGEVEILVGKANERTLAMAKFYRLAWQELAMKWAALMMENAPKHVQLFKIGRDGKAYPKRAFKSDWMSDDGYEPLVQSSSEQEGEDVKGIQKFQFVMQQFPNNQALRRLAQKRELQMLDLSPEELREVEQEEKELMKNMMQPQPGMPGAQPQQPGMEQPMDQETQQLGQDIQSKMGELANFAG